MSRLALRFRNLRIKHKLSAVILLTSTIAVGLAVLTFLGYEISTFRSDRIRALTMLADVLASNSTAALSFKDPEDAAEVLSALKAEPNVIGAALFDEEGIQMSDYQSLGAQHNFSLPSKVPEITEARIENGLLILARPVTLGGQRIGTIYIVSDTLRMRSRIISYALISAGIFGVALLAATLLSGGLQRLISTPIERLAKTAEKVSRGRDYSIRAEKMGDDELGLLTDTFNDMLATVERRRVALQEAHDSLEQRVTTRTLQLRAANRDLERSEGTLRLAVEGAKIGVWSWDIESGELEWSNQCRAIFGIPADDPMSYERFLQALHPDDRDPTDKAVLEALESQGDFKTEYRSIWPDNTLHWIEAIGRGFYTENGDPIRMQGVVLDITPRKSAEVVLKNYADELERSNRELGQFAYVASHDLKEPLRVVISYSDLLKHRYGGKFDEKGERYLNHISTAAKRMRQLITDLLEFSRVGSSGQKLSPLDLSEIVDAALSNLDIAVRDSGAELVGQNGLPTVRGDRSQLVQVFQNLIGNAIKFCTTKPQIEISARRFPNDRRRWEITISDNGPGIAQEYQAQIFQLFKRLDVGREVEGTGIGLAVCRRILERHSGEIWVESEVGKGTQFVFTLADAAS